MNNYTTGKIESSQIFQPAACSPNPMCQRIIYKCRPENGEEQKSRKLHSFRVSTDNQSRCNNGKHHLKGHKNTMRDSGGVIFIRQSAYTVQSCPIQITD